MSKMDTDELSVVLPATTTSTLSLSLHPLPILNISEHLTRLKFQRNTNTPFVLGALLGTQEGREVEIVNSFELSVENEEKGEVDHAFLTSRKEQYKQVFPSLELIGWYTVAQEPTQFHITLHEQFVSYTPNPILLILQPTPSEGSDSMLPIKAYEPIVEIRDRTSRSLFVEVHFTVETGEAERIAVDWASKGGAGGTSLEAHLQTQRAAVQMLQERLRILISYVTEVVAGNAKKDHTTLRALSALIASLPSSEHQEFRQEFDTEYEDVQLTAYLSTLIKSTNALNDLVDKHIILTAPSGRDERGGPMGLRKRQMGRGVPLGMALGW